eukprot:SAG22_NODE_47_length_24699_cov_13.602317_14_plen_205_part_00
MYKSRVRRDVSLVRHDAMHLQRAVVPLMPPLLRAAPSSEAPDPADHARGAIRSSSSPYAYVYGSARAAGAMSGQRARSNGCPSCGAAPPHLATPPLAAAAGGSPAAAACPRPASAARRPPAAAGAATGAPQRPAEQAGASSINRSGFARDGGGGGRHRRPRRVSSGPWTPSGCRTRPGRPGAPLGRHRGRGAEKNPCMHGIACS